MAQNDYIDIRFEDLPMRFEYTFDGVNYNLRMYYNEMNDSFYVDLYDENNVMIVAGEKLVYGEALWSRINDPRLPMVQLVPIDEDANENTVSQLNFPDIVRLSIIDTDYPDDDIPPVDSEDDDTDDDSVEESPSDVAMNDYGNDPYEGGDI